VVAYRIAAENLELGLDVVADTVNPVESTRDMWRRVAFLAECPFLEVEIVCLNRSEHKRRVESRAATLEGHHLPSWIQVESREYDVWTTSPLRIDSSQVQPPEAVALILEQIKQLTSN